MNKLILGCAALFAAGSLSAQTFTDDFESYTSGSYLCPQSPDWTTWSGTEGGTEDVLVSTANAASGSQSLYFSSTSSGGGPEDVVLPFDQVYNSGNFTFEANFFVESGKGAYFNLQGTLVVAQIWALDCYMLQDGTLKLSNQGTPYLTANYPPATWFNMRVEMDLTANVWELFIDNVSMGTFNNPTGQIGILDLYPVNPTGEGGNNQSGFYVDDVSYTHIPATLPNLNGGVTFIEQLPNIAGLTGDVTATVRNMGSSDITSFDIEYSYNGNVVQESVGPVSIASLDTYDHTFSAPALVAAGSNGLTVTISNVNGNGQDDDNTDDAKTITVDPIIPAQGKMVIGEEATGTWCSWCPRGAVYMDLFESKYVNFWEGIAVHNNDPMVVAEYDSGLGGLISGYPSAVVDRGPDVDPSGMEAQFLQRLQTPPVAFISNNSTWNAGTRELSVTVSAEFQSSANSNFKLACVLTEDGVTGTTSGYNQANSYAGGSNGVMGGYELLPSPVPAAQMVYDHVARAIQPYFDGDNTVFPATVNAGETHSATYTFTLPAEWDENNIHIIGMLIEPGGRVDNAAVSTISSNSSISELAISDQIRIYPNPATEFAMIDLNLDKDATIMVNVIDMTGKVVGSQNYGIVHPSTELPINTTLLNSGVYTIEVIVDGVRGTKRLIIE
jgi:hypothetical protein